MNTDSAVISNGLQNYKQKEEVWFDDGREERLLEYVKNRLDANAKNRPANIIHLIDEFGVQQNYMMNVGARKGEIVTTFIEKYKPRTMIELGSYVGYSTILFAAALQAHGGREYVSFEREPKFARVASCLVDLAGLSNIVRFVVGGSSKSLVEENRNGRLRDVDMVFLDHYKPAYTKDLKILESLRCIHPGTVLAADNVIEPGNPVYLEYVRSSPSEKSERLTDSKIATPSKALPPRTVNQYKHYDDDTTELPGIPEIEYESWLEQSYEPTGVPDGIEVTICKSMPA